MTNYKDLVDSETKSLDSYLRLENNNSFLIPFSQRDYEWGNVEVRRLFNDLTSLYDKSKEYHMLNFFTLYRDDNDNLQIFDGQQRTVTSLLILSVIAQRLSKQGNGKAADQIQEDYFTKEDSLHPNRVNQKKLLFDSENDNAFFYKVTNLSFDPENNSISDEITNKNQETIYKNVVYINKLLTDFLKSSGDVDLVSLFTDITEKTLLVEFDASKEEIALNMFESLNNTGKSIEKYYVLKNDMVKCLGEKEVKEKWNAIDSNLNGLSHSAFLISTATLLKGKTSATGVLDHLYPDGKDTKNGMNSLLDLLHESSAEFLKICNENQMTGNKKVLLSEYQAYTAQLRRFGMKQYRPIILAMLLKKRSLSDINRVLGAVLKLTIRNFYFGERKANTIENGFATFARDVYSDKLSTNDLFKKIKDLCISDDELKVMIKRKQLPQNNSKISFVLREVYNSDHLNDELEVSGSNNDVEHILPQTPSENSQWLKWFPDDDERKKYTYSIGNLTLWYSKVNRSAKNAEFSEKKKRYMESGLKENKDIARNTKWTADEINKRSDKIANEIAKAFRV